MDASDRPPEPPVDFPSELGAALRDASVHDLREAIIYAHELLQFHHQPTEQIEPLPGDELVELRERDGYTEIVIRQECSAGCERCPHGPYVYHVTREPQPDGGHALHWEFIGRKSSDTE